MTTALSELYETIARIRTPEGCEQFAINVQDRSPEAAVAARRRAVDLRAAAHNPVDIVEHEALRAVYAYERVLSATRGKKIRASRTWQMIERHGIIAAVERVVSRRADAAGYLALTKEGMLDMAFEAVVLKYPESFSAEAVERSKRRLENWPQDKANQV